MTIGRAMQVFGMTARALRYYEERGLLAVERDKKNARFYDASAQQRLALIAFLRGAVVSLTEILQVIRVEDENGLGRQAAIAALRRRRAELAAETARIEAAFIGFEWPPNPSVVAPPSTPRLRSAPPPAYP